MGNELRASRFRVYSYGVAAQNLSANSSTLEVIPVEDMPMLDGQLTDQISQFQSSGTDAKGAAYQTSSNQSSTLTCKWLPMGQANRMTPPNVRRGEELIIYQYGDSNTDYYWNTLRNDLNFRKLERVVYGFSATQSEGVDPSDDNTYLLTIDTMGKVVGLTTSKDNNEPYAWSLKLDTDNGILQFQDDIGNIFTVDAAQHLVRAENADGAFFQLLGNAISGYAADSIDFKTKAYSVESETYAVKASQSISHETQNSSLKSTANEMDTETMHKGNINTGTGSGGSPGDMVSSGNFTTKGHMEADAGISTKGTVQGVTADFQTYENLPSH